MTENKRENKKWETWSKVTFPESRRLKAKVKLQLVSIPAKFFLKTSPNISKTVTLRWRLTIHRSLLSTIIAIHFRTKSTISAATSITNRMLKEKIILPKTQFPTLWATVLPTATLSASILSIRNSWIIISSKASSITPNKTISSKIMSVHQFMNHKILTTKNSKEFPFLTLKKWNQIAAISSMNNLSLQKVLSTRETRCRIWLLISQETILRTSSQFIMNLQLIHTVIKDSSPNMKEKTFSRTSISLHMNPVDSRTQRLIPERNQTLKKMKS